MSRRSPFEKATVYHSALRAETEEEPLEITLLSDGPEMSKFKKLQVAFKCEGETHYLVVENDECGEALSGMKGETVRITATGSKEDAAIEVEGGGSRSGRDRDERPARNREPERHSERREHDDPPPRRESRERDPEPEKPRETREEIELREFKKGAVLGARSSILFAMAMKYARPLVEAELCNSKDPQFMEHLRIVATTLYIDLNRSIDTNKMPSHWIDLKKPAPKQEPPPPEPKREEPPPRQREPDPADDAAEDDIPF